MYEFNVPTFGKGVVFDVDHKVRAEQFRFFADSLGTLRMKTYIGMMVSEAEVFGVHVLCNKKGVLIDWTCFGLSGFLWTMGRRRRSRYPAEVE